MIAGEAQRLELLVLNWEKPENLKMSSLDRLRELLTQVSGLSLNIADALAEEWADEFYDLECFGLPLHLICSRMGITS